ncbi:phosphatase PAP2 family protein [Micromonospora sp. STR1_7]|uniref:Phosphatase PAP2 family protein n=1 Tax=Micromonospora parastrephiae TaxID=2806101 RepID=A0ABS1XWX7_9ACTN|nr:phosphatase PAP2 family protein [Micromonospora parastrephiae]MBM0233781.1 phosphatase PAP2 family protein [Micromonospora parastrephiae]
MSSGSSYFLGRPTPGPPLPLPDAREAVPSSPRLLGAAVCALLALGLTGVLFVWTYPGQWLDGLLLPRAERGGGYAQQSTLLDPARSVLAAFGSTLLLAGLLGAVLLVGLAGRRLLAALVGVGMVLCAVVVSGAAKSTLLRPDLQVESSTTHNSFPSGHVAAATTLLLAFMLVLPAGARRWLALPGAAGVTVIAAATMVAGWHRFSDALGGVLLGVALFCLAAAALASWPGVARPTPGAVEVTRRGGGAAWRGLAETVVGLVGLGSVLLVVVPGLSAALPPGALVAILAVAGLTTLAVGSAVYLVRSTDFARPSNRSTKG